MDILFPYNDMDIDSTMHYKLNEPIISLVTEEIPYVVILYLWSHKHYVRNGFSNGMKEFDGII